LFVGQIFPKYFWLASLHLELFGEIFIEHLCHMWWGFAPFRNASSLLNVSFFRKRMDELSEFRSSTAWFLYWHHCRIATNRPMTDQRCKVLHLASFESDILSFNPTVCSES
jgi:hypothetical protein